MAALQQGAAELATINSLNLKQPRISRGTRLRWATLDKTKAAGILSRVRNIEQALTVCVIVVNV